MHIQHHVLIFTFAPYYFQGSWQVHPLCGLKNLLFCPSSPQQHFRISCFSSDPRFFILHIPMSLNSEATFSKRMSTSNSQVTKQYLSTKCGNPIHQAALDKFCEILCQGNCPNEWTPRSHIIPFPGYANWENCCAMARKSRWEIGVETMQTTLSLYTRKHFVTTNCKEKCTRTTCLYLNDVHLLFVDQCIDDCVFVNTRNCALE